MTAPATTTPLSAALFSAGTTLGLGLLGSLGVFSASGLVPDDRLLGAIGLGLALGATLLGLTAGLRAPGRPEADWPLHGQWRNSWAARAGIFATGAVAAGLMFAIGWVILGNRGGPWQWFGLFATSFSLIAVHGTSMIYVSRHDVPQWSNRWVTPNFLAQAALTGALWQNALAVGFGHDSPQMALFVVAALFFAFYVKRRYWRLIDMIAQALGREGMAPDTVRKDRRTAFLCLYALPLLLTVYGMGKAPEVAIPVISLAALSAAGGLIVERRLFLAEAAPLALPPAPPEPPEDAPPGESD